MKQPCANMPMTRACGCSDTFDRQERQAREAQVKEDAIEALAEKFPEREADIADALVLPEQGSHAPQDHRARASVPDGGATEIRPIWCEVGVLPRTHGTAVFTRGQTQALTVTTLGSLREVQILDGLSNEDSKRYIHHYNMPPYATGEARRMQEPRPPRDRSRRAGGARAASP